MILVMEGLLETVDIVLQDDRQQKVDALSMPDFKLGQTKYSNGSSIGSEVLKNDYRA